jgi:hypothetical protein
MIRNNWIDTSVTLASSFLEHTERIVTDASSGSVLGTLETRGVDWLVDLHHNLRGRRYCPVRSEHHRTWTAGLDRWPAYH